MPIPNVSFVYGFQVVPFQDRVGLLQNVRSFNKSRLTWHAVNVNTAMNTWERTRVAHRITLEVAG